MKKVILDLVVTPEGANNRVRSIVQLRRATGMGLKEAKDTVDAILEGGHYTRRTIMYAEDLLMLLETGEGRGCFSMMNLEACQGSTILDLTAAR